MVAHAAENNVVLDFMALKDPYEGVGVHALNMVQADKVLNGFFYSGEKKPHISMGKLKICNLPLCFCRVNICFLNLKKRSHVNYLMDASKDNILSYRKNAFFSLFNFCY